MTTRRVTRDADLAGAQAAAERAADQAWRLALATNTPFYVFKHGRIVNLNARAIRSAKRIARRRSR